MKTKLFLILTVALGLLAGCATKPNDAHCVVLEFNHMPSAATQSALLATTHDTTAAELHGWFADGQRRFVINDHNPAVDRPALAAALADGAVIIKH